MLFSQVVGQQQVKQHLLDMVQQNRLSHALLFLGAEGSGALPMALAFAQYVSLLPSSVKQPAEASLFGDAASSVPLEFPKTAEDADAFMQKQPGFSKAENYVHPDIHYSYPVIPKKIGRQAGKHRLRR
jgi:DNA polymerase-3 subunit delta'